MRIVRALPAELDSIDPLRRALWPDSPIDDLKHIVETRPEYLVLVARAGGDEPVGFAEAGLRHDFVNGCRTSPVGFLEGIYVTPEHRQQGIARAMVDEAMRWARERGVSEFASDARLDNEASHAFHRAIGFAETSRVVYFRKPLAEPGE
jgi:aminoglycoside 6'-N-acetyltransferase I